eukprot:SM000171S03239  [mRNA]  locus=s171:121333:124239:- [translate_table: standard]
MCRHNVTGLINHVFGDLREQLAFIWATRANLPTAGSEEAVRCAEGSYDFSQTRRIRLPASKSSGSSRLYTEEHRGDKVDASSLGSSYQHQARTYTDKEDRYSSSGYGDLIPRSSSQIQDKEDRLHSPYASSQAGLRSQPSLAGNDTRTRLVQHVQSAQDRSRQDGKVSVSCDQYLDLSSGRSGRRMADWQDVCPSYGEDPVNAQALLGNCSMSGDVDIPSRYDYADSYGWSTAQVSQEDCNTRVPSQYFYANAYGWSSQQEVQEPKETGANLGLLVVVSYQPAQDDVAETEAQKRAAAKGVGSKGQSEMPHTDMSWGLLWLSDKEQCL